DPEWVREPALRQAPREWHLTAFEVRLPASGAAVAAAGHGTLMSLSGCLPLPRPRAASEALPPPMRARRRHQVVQPDFLERFHDALLLDRRDRDQMPHALDHAAKRSGILLDDFILMVLEPQRLERRAHPRRVADAAPHLLDAQAAGPRRDFFWRVLG